MRTSVEGRRVIITAGAGGIGSATIEQLLTAGARVATCDISDEGIAGLRKRFPTLHAEIVNVADAKAQTAFMNDAIDRMGGIDALINNAGISGPTAHVEDIDVADWDHVFRVNVESHFVACKVVVPYLRKQKDGSIIFISSTAGRLGFAMRTPYSASKWALVGLMKSLTNEIGPDGVRVNAIMPGVVDGERIRRVITAKAEAENISYEEMESQWLKPVSLRRMVSQQELAEMMQFLISDAGRNITGQTISICGNQETLR